ncbi:MAG: thioredoxin fold domain-containing protein [Candidatus Methanoperedens sp.]|nr:thioredoxin fold domain-containing protein [Candidatus Methanoperedens sp.]
MNIKKWMPILLALLLLISGCLNAQSDKPESGKMTLKGLEFYTDLKPALDDSKAQDKPIFVYFRSETCGWCKKFEAESFTNQSIIKTLNENFILVSIDVYEQKNETTYFKVRGTPTEVFLDSNFKEITRIPGYTDNGTFLNTINEIAILIRGSKNETR